MTGPLGDLRRTSDGLLEDLERLVALEEEKRTVPADDPRLVELAREVEEVAARVLAHSAAQRQLSEEVTSALPPDAPSIDETSRPIAAILAEWRATEHQLATIEPDSPDAAALERRIGLLRDEYRRAYERAAGRSGQQ